MSDINQDAILYMAFMFVVVFVILASTVALQDDLGQPEVTEFNDNGLTEPLVLEETDNWEIVERNGNTVVLNGTVYRLGSVNLSADNVERTDEGVVLDVQVNETQELQPINVRSSLTDQPVNTVYPPLFGGGYEFNATITNVGEDENVTVNYLDDQSDDSDEDSM